MLISFVIIKLSLVLPEDCAFRLKRSRSPPYSRSVICSVHIPGEVSVCTANPIKPWYLAMPKLRHFEGSGALQRQAGQVEDLGHGFAAAGHDDREVLRCGSDREGVIAGADGSSRAAG